MRLDGLGRLPVEIRNPIVQYSLDTFYPLQQFRTLLLVCKTWKRIFYPEDNCSTSTKIVFEDLILKITECYLTPKQFKLFIEKLPHMSFGSLLIYLGEHDNGRITGDMLSSLLKKNMIERLEIIPQRDIKDLLKLPLKERAEKEKWEKNRGEQESFKSYPAKIGKVMKYLKGAIPELTLKGGRHARESVEISYYNPSKCEMEIEGLQVEKLHFTSDWDFEKASIIASFGQLQLKELSIEYPPNGNTLTQMLKTQTRLEKLFLDKVHFYDNELLLDGISLKELKIRSSKASGEPLQRALRAQTCLTKLDLWITECNLLPGVFAMSPIEELYLDGMKSCDENNLKQALQSIKGTLRELVIKNMTITGDCLEGLQLENLELKSVQGFNEEIFKKVLASRKLKRLVITSTDITGDCLQHAQVEALKIYGVIHTLDKGLLSQALEQMKGELKTLSIDCSEIVAYRGMLLT